LPHHELDREEALELAEGVFGPTLEAPAGIFDELEPKQIVGPNVVLLPGDLDSSQPRAEQDDDSTEASLETQEKLLVNEGMLPWEAAEALAGDHLTAGEIAPVVEGGTLLSSTVPLTTEGPRGDPEPVDLSLERVGEELRPENPLAEVAIPSEIGAGLELPEVGVSVGLATSADERAPSILGDAVAFYPNVSTDTDFALAPTPSGVETFTQIRTPDAPQSQTLEFTVPSGASLQKMDDGGAEVVRGNESLVKISPPAALDAHGIPVKVEMEVAESSLELTVKPTGATTYPILVDPLIQVYQWMKTHNPQGIYTEPGQEWWKPQHQTHYGEQWSPEIRNTGAGAHFWPSAYMANGGTPALNVWAPYENETTAPAAWDHGAWLYTVPRFYSDYEKYGVRPTSYIEQLTLSELYWFAYSKHPSPYLFAGLWSASQNNWVSYYSHTGEEGHGLFEPTHQYVFSANQCTGNTCVLNKTSNVAVVEQTATEAVPAPLAAELDVGFAAVQLGDSEAPEQPIPTVSSTWTNAAPTALGFKATDKGLGVSTVTASTEQLGSNGLPLYSWNASYGCSGGAGSACPRVWDSTEGGHEALMVHPALLPTGVDHLNLIAEDPVGNRSGAASAIVKVDHVSPVVSVTGTATEQAALGASRPSYVVKASAVDGTSGSPQSGVAKEIVQFDGSVVQASETGCASENCSKSLEWTINPSNYAPGAHVIRVTAVDAVGNSAAPQEIQINLRSAPPTLSLSGSLTEQATVGVFRPRYLLKEDAAAEAAVEASPTPQYVSTFGSSGAGNGQFSHPADVAPDSKGNVWVVDQKNNRLEEFNEKGEFLKIQGTAGAGSGQFTAPKSIAFAADGSFWVADSGNNRLEQFSATGQFLKAVGGLGSGNGQFKGPESITIDQHGNIWVADTANLRVQELNGKGEFVKVVNPAGLGAIEPVGLDVAPDGKVWVADWAHNRVVEFNEAGAFVGQIGSAGAGNGQFDRPNGVTVDSKGYVWVCDQNNGRIQGFNSSGEYITQFGSLGSETGQFRFTFPSGLGVDSKGNIWIADSVNNRIQKWRVGPYGYLGFIGGAGSGSGQFSHPADVAVAPKGHIWVLDKGNNRLEKFKEGGEFIGAYSGAGSTGAKLNAPSALSVDPSGNVWVADTGNNRIEEFSEFGAFIAVIGKDVNKTKVGSGGTEAERNYCSAASGNVCQAGPEGTAPGQLKAPQGIAATSSGNIWVADTGHSRMEKYTPTGGLLNNSFQEGSEPGKLKAPAAVSMGPDGSIWVADTGNNRIERWLGTELGSPAGVYGSEGTGNGQFKHPAALEVDSAGNVWVGDEGNSRVEEFNQAGEFLGKIGTPGAGNGQFAFSAPMGLALGNGNLLVTDTDNNRIQRWEPSPRSELWTEITMDGKQVDAAGVMCNAQRCPATREWFLQSSSTAAGKHTIVAKVNDNLGNVTTKTLNIEVQPDKTAPSIEASGSLFSAPEGWVEQANYALTASAKDSGAGVTSLVLRIDGQQVASNSASCPDGGCAVALQKTIDMAPYSGGAHQAELIATDGAGNTQTRKWTINVDPDGHISTDEATATLEAVEATTEEAPVAPPAELLDPKQIQEGENPELAVTGSKIESRGVPDTTTLTTSPAEGFRIETPDGTATITPVIGGQASSTAVEEDVAGVTANTSLETDSVVRPEYNGVQTFQEIRSAQSPETFSWHINLEGGETLVLVNEQQAEVRYQDGSHAFLINAESAHDATGKSVPTSFGVSGNVLTLKVSHRSGAFVYPVVAGQGWEGSYVAPVLIAGPEDNLEKSQRERREEEARNREALEEIERAQGNEGWTASPLPGGHLSPAAAEEMLLSRAVGSEVIEVPAAEGGGGGASASSTRYVETVRPFKVCQVDHCGIWWVEIRNPSYFYGRHGNRWAKWEAGTQVHSEWWWQWFYSLSLSIEGEQPGFAGQNYVEEGEHKHLTAWSRYIIKAYGYLPSGDVLNFDEHLGLQIWVWPNGEQVHKITHWAPAGPPIAEA